MPGIHAARRLLPVALVVAFIATACNDGVRHPLDDSEARPATAAVALAEATAELDAVGAAALADVAYEATEWDAPGGCATSPDSPEQGDVGRILYRSYASTPAGESATDVIDAATLHWTEQGLSVGPGAPNMPDQAITRVDGISYSVVDTSPGVELRAFLPCY